MSVTVLFVLLAVAGLATGRNLQLRNKLGDTVWVGIQGTDGIGQPDNGGFALIRKESINVIVADGWAGRVWARTGCIFNSHGEGHCVTGDCGNKLHCNGTGGVPPVTMAEIALKNAGGKDYYDVSLVDGFNVPVEIRPISRGVEEYPCIKAGCNDDLKRGCPENIKVWDGDNLVACNSSCLANNTDENCCRGAFKNNILCKSSPSAVYFKSKCPDTYAYAGDDETSTFTCQDTDYDIIFG